MSGVCALCVLVLLGCACDCGLVCVLCQCVLCVCAVWRVDQTSCASRFSLDACLISGLGVCLVRQVCMQGT